MPPSALAVFNEHKVTRPHILAEGQKSKMEKYSWNSQLQWTWLNQAGYSRQDLFDFGKKVGEAGKPRGASTPALLPLAASRPPFAADHGD